MRGLGLRRILVALAVALAFGVVYSVLKGNGGGIRDAAGNVSAPWLILPLLAGAVAAPRRAAVGALVGLAVTLAALVGFYLTNAFVLDLGPHSTLHDVALTMSAVGGTWFHYGVISGCLCGAAGSWMAGRGSATALVATVAALLILEPVAWVGWILANGQSLGATATSPLIWGLEVGCGLLLIVALRARQSARR